MEKIKTMEEAMLNPELTEVVQVDNALKDFIVEYSGEELNPENNEVTVEMVIEVLASHFPEVVFALAEENFIRGYQQAMNDLEVSEEEGAYETAIVFFAELLNYFEWNTSNHLKPHKWWNNKWCPRLILPIWNSDFVPNVNRKMKELKEKEVSMKEVYTIKQKFDFLGTEKELEIKNIDGRIYLSAENLRELGLTVNWNDEKKMVEVTL